MSIPPGPGNTTVRRGGWVRGGWVRVLSRVPPSSRPVRWSSGRVFARWGHRRCLYSRGLGTHGSGEWNRPGGGVVGRVLSSLRVVRRGPAGPGGRKRRGRRVVCSPGGAIDVVYTPAAREHTGRGNGAARGRARGLGLWVGSPPLFAWFAGVLLGPVGRVLLLSLSVRWGGTAGIRAGRGRSDPWGRSGRSGPRRACGGCGLWG